MGSDYRDVTKFIDAPAKNSSSDGTQNLSNLRVKNKKVTVIIDFKDWKYLSSTQRFQVDVTDPEIIKGEKEG